MIRTARLLLRTAREADLHDLHAVLSHPEAMRYWSTAPHTELDATRAWLAAMIAGGPDASDFVIELDGRVVGKAGFYRPPELGYILHPDAWGRGIATEAVTAAIDHLFATKPFERITTDVDPRNTASIRLLERLGFRRTGSAERTLEIDGVWTDSVYFALDRGDWRPRG